VFALGLLLMEVCTLKSPAECYDLTSYSILDEVITARIEEIEEIYSRKIVSIVANMLDYDFEERMNSKQLSIWVNRTLSDLSEEGDQCEKPAHSNSSQGIVHSRLIE
jgi:hypothetical protein